MDRNVSVRLVGASKGPARELMIRRDGERRRKISHAYTRLDNRQAAAVRYRSRPSRLNCDQGLNGDSQGRYEYVTDFYDLFAFAVRLARIIDSIQRIPSAPRAVGRTWSDAGGLWGRIRVVQSRPGVVSLKWLATPFCPRYEIEAGINFTVRLGKEILPEERTILATRNVSASIAAPADII